MSPLNDAWSAAVSVIRLGRGSSVRHVARSPERPLELWEFEACPFCRKVREELSELDLEYVCHPTARGSNNRDAPQSLGGRKSFPYLVDPNTGAAMHESEDIIDYLHATYGRGPRRAPLAPLLRRLNTLGASVASAIRPRGRVTSGPAARRTQPAERLVLYQFEGCPACRKVRERLHELNLDFSAKSCAKGSRRRAELRELGGRAMVPYLIDPNTGAAMYESDGICRYLDDQYG